MTFTKVCLRVGAALGLGLVLSGPLRANPINSYGYNAYFPQSLQIDFSAPFVGINQLISAMWAAAPPAQITGDVSADPAQAVSFSSPLTSVTGALSYAPDMASTVSGVSAVGSLGGIVITAPLSSAASGGSLQLLNFSFDLPSETVYADVYANGVSKGRIGMFTASSLAGPNPILVDNFDGLGEVTFTLNAPDLLWTSAGLDAYSQAVGLNSTYKAIASDTVIGTLSVTAIPEPSAYAFLALGLLTLMATAVRPARATRRPGL